MTALQWMAWTPQVAVFFVGIGAMLLGMTVWEMASPTAPRRGFLPLQTTRGDRLFIGLLAAAFLNLGWAGLTDVTQWGGAALGAIMLFVVMKWG